MKDVSTWSSPHFPHILSLSTHKLGNVSPLKTKLQGCRIEPVDFFTKSFTKTFIFIVCSTKRKQPGQKRCHCGFTSSCHPEYNLLQHAGNKKKSQKQNEKKKVFMIKPLRNLASVVYTWRQRTHCHFAGKASFFFLYVWCSKHYSNTEKNSYPVCIVYTTLPGFQKKSDV